MKLNTISLGLVAMAASGVCLADEPATRHQITAGSNAIGYGSSRGWEASLFTGYRYALTPWLQLGGSVSDYITQPKGSAAFHYLGFRVGPTFNYSFDNDLRSAWFLSTEFGYSFERLNGAWQKGNPDLHLALGKRFKLGENVSYDPSVGVNLTRVNGNTQTEYQVTPLSFSLHF